MDADGFAERLLSRSLRSLSSVEIDRGPWLDAVEQMARGRDRRVYKDAFGHDRGDHVRRGFGHIIVNPHRRENTDALVKSYVYASDRPPETVFVNGSAEDTEDFVRELIRRAHDARTAILTIDQDSAGASTSSWGHLHLILYGKRGSGKTFFLNHVLSKYSGLFDRERVIWLRLNLVEPFGLDENHPSAFDLELRVYAQLAKIVFRYYDPKSEFYVSKPEPLDLSGDLFDFVQERSPNQTTSQALNQSIMDIRQAFGTKGVDPPLSPELVPTFIGRKLLQLARARGYAIICVLDGLDRLEISSQDRHRFDRLFKAAVRLNNTSGSLGVMVVSVTRTNTLNTLPDVPIRGNPYSYGEVEARELYPASIDLILRRRIEFLRDHVAEVAKTEPWDMRDWPTHLDDFLHFLSESEEDASDYLTGIFGENRRAQMQVVQFRYFDFLRKGRGEASAYRFLESLVLAGQAYPPKHYKYAMTGKGGWTRRSSGGAAFDNHLLPSIFDYPFVDWELSGAIDPPAPALQGVLWGVRILQLVAASEWRARQHERYVDRIMSKEVADVLYTLFGYPRSQTYLLVDQLCEQECIRQGRPDYAAPTTSRRQFVYLMAKGRYILRKFLADIAYLSLCTMRLPLQVSKQRSGLPYFVAPRLSAASTIDERDTDLAEWISAKVINSCALVRLISTLNTQQEFGARVKSSLLDNRLQEIIEQAVQGVESEFEGMFHLPRALEDAVRHQVATASAVLKRDAPTAAHLVDLRLAAYWDAWKDS